MHWIVRDRYIGSAFFDASAAAFVMPVLKERSHVHTTTTTTTKVDTASIPIDDESMDTSSHASPVDGNSSSARIVGCAQTLSATLADTPPVDGSAFATSPTHPADHLMSGYGLGPEWMAKTAFKSAVMEKMGTRGGEVKNHLTIHYEQEVVEVVVDRDDDDDDGDDGHLCGISSTERSTAAASLSSSNSSDRPMRIRTTSGAIIKCDFAVSAVGVVPNTDFLSHNRCVGFDPGSNSSNNNNNNNNNNNLIIDLDEEGFIVVDHTLACCPSIADRSVYAAGDCCSYPDLQPLYERTSSEGRAAHPTAPVGHFFQMRLWTQVLTVTVLVTHNPSARF